MNIKLSPAADDQILEIWDYTALKWGEEQADSYVRGLVEAMNQVHAMPHRWRKLADKQLSRIFFIRYRHHSIFFMKLAKGEMGIVAILHESMDLPTHLKTNILAFINDSP